MNWPPALHTELLSKLGVLLLEWNASENGLRTIITAFFERNVASRMLTAEMDNRDLCNTILTVANEFADDDEKMHLTHIVKYVERTREYRNYYVHGFSNIALKDGKPSAVLTTWSAKKRLTVHQHWFGIDEIAPVVEMCSALHSYVSKVHQAVAYRRGLIPPPPGEKRQPPIPLPKQLPRLPDRLKKPLRYPLDE